MQTKRHSMPGKTTFLIIACIMCSLFNGTGQISPGDLSQPHAHLEGMLNCTKCHVLGDKVTNEKCLECHKEIKTRIDQKKGYHASSEVLNKDCFTCHSDHHGRNFEIIRFDADRFNHQLTGYTLTGAHREQECTACHKDEFISSPEIRNKGNTYLGLRTECTACHKDVHRNTLSQDCASCHTTDAFAPATLFDHGKTEFALKGKHKEVDCRPCHEITFSNSALFQQFAGVPFNSCAVCHEDVHQGKLGNNCNECHNEESFHTILVNSAFNHSKTQFPLKGKHQKVNCTSCHQTGENAVAENAFQDYRNKDFNNCIACHSDVHESKFGSNCKECHTEESFQVLLNASLFDHDPTGYPLEGKHEQVDCRKCHETKMVNPLAHDRCLDCHADFHQSQFMTGTQTTDCANCHTVEGFSGAAYSIEQHNQGAFPLEGAHLATPCFSCHLIEGKWTFKNIGSQCVDCHKNIHEGFLSEQYYPENNCTQCHIPDNWARVSFDHIQTGFELQGKHVKTNCASCHLPDEASTDVVQIAFTGLVSECSSCHENIHGDQFDEEGPAGCRRCHGFEQWKPSIFDHSTARFKLDGAHMKVSCDKCHKEEEEGGKWVIKYKLEQFECATCHL